ncbi:transaldolase [Reyranella sp.]|uniref:transaldolase n=1 Tax=Reyranella sp. TaxID=1929291 RepID=UPI003BAA4AAF
MLRTKIFADGADLPTLEALCANPAIRGFTTNPTLMRKAGVSDYAAFARSALDLVGDRPISFEIFSDELDEMERQARTLAGWGSNVYVKVPVTNTRGVSAADLARRLSQSGVRVNVTAVMTLAQVETLAKSLHGGAPSNISIFAGRIADTGIDPVPLMRQALEIVRPSPTIELIWASPRELLNLVQASEIGCHIITVTADILGKLPLLGRNLDEYSLDTVKMFHGDAAAAGYRL